MMTEMWKLFPRLVEQKINSLLDTALPTQAKAFYLYKACKNDGLWSDSFEKFSEQLKTYFLRPLTARRKSDIDAFLERPIDMSFFESFQLDFRNADVAIQDVSKVSGWAHNMLRINCRTQSSVISVDVLSKTIDAIIHPTFLDKAKDISFEDFCSTWQKIVARIFGRDKDAEFNDIIFQLKALEEKLLKAEKETRDVFVPTVYLTQTEIDWVQTILSSIEAGLRAPKYPLSKGTEKPLLVELEEVIYLYNIVFSTKDDRLAQHRDRIVVTIQNKCQKLLRECAR